ncbi:MAG: hypothetical protein HZB16_21030 [Armatimonadetes bacterium]|nr:hypothetical protein [Armatimonadota bacterium]
MRPRRRLSLLPWTAAANGVALLVLFSTARHLPDARTTDSTAPRAELVTPAPSAPAPPDQVTIKKQVVHHVPGPKVAPPRMPKPPWPWMTPLPQPNPGWMALSNPVDPLRDALDTALRTGEGWLTEKGRTLHVVLPRADQPAPTAATGLVIAAADDTAPAAAADWRALADDDPLWRRPHDVRAWRRSVGCGPAVLNADAHALWLPAAVRAGWLAHRPEALRLLRNALADDRLQ